MTINYHAELRQYFSKEESPAKSIKVELQKGGGTEGSIIGRFAILPDKVHLLVINGILIKAGDCEGFALFNGDVLEIWPYSSGN